MNRNILLVEPAYKTKFPPLGLMKISTYHKTIGDNVHFVKGWNHDILYTSWDRIYITTLFTYHWKVTVDTIKWYKELVKGDISRIYVGGIMAGLMRQELWKETGINQIVKGTLGSSKCIGDNNSYVIDEMIPDYSLYNGIQHKYTLLDSYFGYSTRGCPNRCPFCGVHELEPEFIDYKGIKPYIEKIDDAFGKKQHLILFDNNILASRHFDRLINDLLDIGFQKDARINKKLRHVDFNQGVDVRLINEEHYRLLSKIAINPLRIAFDSLKLRKIYEKKVKLAARYGIEHLSNYILYNYKDSPEEFWQRLKINIDLNKELGLKIYSYPMKYIPLNSKDRSYISEPSWNWQFIRGVQRILNVLRGSVMPGEDFFNRAFGSNSNEFMTILYMPESILMNRGREPKNEEYDWYNRFAKLTNNEKKELLALLCENRTRKKLSIAVAGVRNKKLSDILDYYLPDYNLPLFEEYD